MNKDKRLLACMIAVMAMGIAGCSDNSDKTHKDRETKEPTDTYVQDTTIDVDNTEETETEGNSEE